MSEKNLVICDSEFCYANSLSENVLKRKELNVKVYTFTSLEKVISFLQEKKIHILIVDDSYTYEERSRIGAEQIFVLMQGGVLDLGENEQAVYKYQCADQIIHQVFEAYVEKTNEDVLRHVRKTRTRLEAIYSPIHGIGKTSFAIALGKEWAKKERILYLNLEEYAGFEEEISDENMLNLGDLLYYIRQSEGNLGIRLQSAMQNIGELHYVPPIFLSVDLKEVPFEDWKTLLEQLVNLSLYDVILLDLGESVNGLFQILEMCDRIYMPIKEDEVSGQKLLRYEKCLKRLALEKISNVTEQFVMPENIEEYVRIRMKEMM